MARSLGLCGRKVGDARLVVMEIERLRPGQRRVASMSASNGACHKRLAQVAVETLIKEARGCVALGPWGGFEAKWEHPVGQEMPLQRCSLQILSAAARSLGEDMLLNSISCSF